MSSSDEYSQEEYSEYSNEEEEVENDGWEGGGEDGEDAADEYEEYAEENEEDEVVDEIREEEIPMLSDMKTIFEGHGDKFPEKGSLCRIHYSTKLLDGKRIESSRDRNRPLVCKVGVGNLVRGWDECLLKMVEGQHVTIVCPPEAAYGDEGLPPKIPPKTTLIFDVELIKIVKPPPPTSFNLRIDEELSSDPSSDEYYSDQSLGEDRWGEDFGEDGED